MTNKKTIKIDKLFELFCGEEINVMLNKDSRQTVETDTKVETIKGPIVVSGYLVEADDDFIYLGYNPDMISSAISKKSIVHIEISSSQIDEILNDINYPKGEDEFN